MEKKQKIVGHVCIVRRFLQINVGQREYDTYMIYDPIFRVHNIHTNIRQLNLLDIQANQACGSFDTDRQTVSSIYYYCYVCTYVVRIMYDT